MIWLLGTLYGLLATVSLVNLLLMRRVRPSSGSTDSVVFLIPARNEAENLARLLPLLDAKFYVYDDQSEDGTGEIAAENGAKVIRGQELPDGWTGKNHACHRLAQVAAEDSNADWWIFLDADTYPEPGFAPAIATFLKAARTPVVTGFARGLPGRGIEPFFLAWVGWVLLATNPFGLVARTSKGHNRFTNGQFTAWRATTYTDLWPNEKLKGRILEDVLIGRLLAKEDIRVEVVNLSKILSVKMYDTWRQALDGMSKNSYEITGSIAGTLFLAALLLTVAWGWLLLPWLLVVLIFSTLCTALTVRYPLWIVPFAPITITIGALTLLRSLIWHRRGKVHWKGRVYPG